MMKARIVILISTLPLAVSCVWTESIEEKIAGVLARSCPAAESDDAGARDRCADALTRSDELRLNMAPLIYWGARAAGTSLERAIDDSHVTDFNSLVWRRIYLSVFTFDGPGKIEAAGKYRVLRMPVHFRNAMDAGEYPYPFWHSQKKWQSYEQSPELLFYFHNGVLIGALRSESLDASRSHVERVFDGKWIWDNGQEPRVTLFASLLHENNPHLPRLEQTYRDFAEGLRERNCDACHSPDNPSMMKHLELLNYPNQALAGRHDVVRILKENTMPPGTGIADQNIREQLIRRAEAFALAADEALEYEGEPIQR